MTKTLLFLNGTAPTELPQLDEFDFIACTDGALHYLKSLHFPLEKLDLISGDFDSYPEKEAHIPADKWQHTPNQDYTDFHKALDILHQLGKEEVWVYGASGKEQDHFLGNLHTAYLFKEKLSLYFVDDHAKYFFAPPQLTISETKDKTISLFPFPTAEGVTTKGLCWELNNETLSITTRVGIRNRAELESVEINHQSGGLVIFVNHQ